MSPVIGAPVYVGGTKPQKWSPHLRTTDGVVVNVGSAGSISGSFEVQGDRVNGTLTILFAGSGISYGTASTDYYVPMPLPAAVTVDSGGSIIGTVSIGDTGTNRAVGATIYMLLSAAKPAMQFRMGGTAIGNVGSSSPYSGTLASIRVSFSYRVDPVWLLGDDKLTPGQGYTLSPTMFIDSRTEDASNLTFTLVDPATTSGQQPAGQTGYSLVMSEEFNGTLTTYDPISSVVQCRTNGPLWQTHYRDNSTSGHTITHAANNTREQQWYSRRQVSLDGNGTLVLTATKDLAHTASGQPYTSGMVNPWPCFSFQNGFIEAKLKIDRVSGTWPAFWMIAAPYIYPPEVDILEQFGTDPVGRITTFGNVSGSGSLVLFSNGADASQWHVYGCKWTPTSLDFYVDGVRIASETNVAAVPQVPLYPILNVAVDSQQTIDDANFPIHMYADYIRVWQ